MKHLIISEWNSLYKSFAKQFLSLDTPPDILKNLISGGYLVVMWVIVNEFLKIAIIDQVVKKHFHDQEKYTHVHCVIAKNDRK